MCNVILLYTLHFTHYTAFAQGISSSELIDKAKEYEGKTVVYEGEVIGEVMARGDFAWVNLYDGNNAIGIWLPKNLTQDIVYAGGYQSQGDRLEVVGVFQRACPEHGGDLDIHAQAVRKTDSGRLSLEKLNLAKRNLALILGAVLVLIWILSLLRRR
jgi:hypothetical protein